MSLKKQQRGRSIDRTYLRFFRWWKYFLIPLLKLTGKGCMNFRYSFINDWIKCPVAAYKRHVLGEADPVKSSALEFGTAMHSAIEAAFDGDDPIALFTMYWDSLKGVEMQYYQHSWEDLRDLAVNKFIPNFVSRHRKKFGKVITREQKLSMPFLGDHTLEGTMDLLSEYEGVVTLTDWKTSTAPYKQSKIEKNPQMYIYAALAKANNLPVPEQLQYKVFVKTTGNIQTIQRKNLTDSDIHTNIVQVENIASTILWSIENKKLFHNYESCYCRGD
jgi:hypothetical protein